MGTEGEYWRSRLDHREKKKRYLVVCNKCGGLPWIGKVTKWHLAKNYGFNVAKPDRHLVRIAGKYGKSVTQLCQDLAQVTGDRLATVDLVIWRAANLGWL